MPTFVIVLLIIAIACEVISCFTGDNGTQSTSVPGEPDSEAFIKLRKESLSRASDEAEKLYNETEERLEALSNDKIMAVGEYSDTVIAKIENNHKEAVFLYKMIKEKEDELKATASKLESARIECEKLLHDNALSGEESPDYISGYPQEVSATDGYFTPGQVSQPAAADEAVSSYPHKAAKKNGGKKSTANKAKSDDNENKFGTVNDSGSFNSTGSTYSDKGEIKSNSGRAGRTYGWGEALAMTSEEDEMDSISERNQEIISLYRKNKSVLEISKLLGMGQGEVKLVIDLYCR